MSYGEPSFTLGIEEEYLIVDRETRDLVHSPDPAFMQRCSEVTGEKSTPEFLQCQVEVGTAPHASVPEAIADLAALRRGVAQAAAEFGYAPIAASTHPFARWRDQHHIFMLLFDRLDAARRADAHELFGELIDDAAAAGFGEYRTHLNFMDQVAATYDWNDGALLRLHERLKDVLDRDGILSPGKMGIWPARMRGA